MLLEEWLRRSAVPLAGSVVVVAISLAVRLLAHRLQVADPGSPPIAALRLFDVNSERNVPTAWSVALLLSAVALAGSLAVVEDRSRAGGWALVTLVSAALALDEWFALHERLGALGAAVADDALHFAWVVPGALVAGVVGLVLLTALRGQPPVVRRRLSVCGLFHLTGALGLETVSGPCSPPTATARATSWSPRSRRGSRWRASRCCWARCCWPASPRSAALPRPCAPERVRRGACSLPWPCVRRPRS